MTQFTRDELFELAAAYAVGATTREESAAVEAAMRTSPDLAAEVAAFRDVSAQMAQQQTMQPSPSLRDAFLKRVAESKTPKPLPVQVRTRSALGPWFLVASVTIVAGVLGNQLRLKTEQIQRRDEALTAATLEAQLREKQLNTILEGDKDLHLVHLTTSDTSGAGIQFFWNAKQGRGLVHAFRLKPAPAGRAYQVWLLAKGKPVGVKVFNSDPDGHALVIDIALPRSVEGVTDVLVTEEPAGGSPLPTTTPFIGGKLRAE